MKRFLKKNRNCSNLKIFDDQDECQQRILSLSLEDRQVSSIYVFCMDNKVNEQWAKDFIKIKSVIVQLKDLIHIIKQNINKADQSTILD